MLFNSLPFALFFVVVWAVLRSVPRTARPASLLAASLLFYSMWRPAHLALLGADVLVNWWLLGAIVRGNRAALVASVTFTLGLLAFFKYAAFAVESVAPVLASLPMGPLPIPEIALPLGISFFSFQIVGLSIDASRGRLAERPPLARYALFVSFFPQLIAGPILRGSEMLPQLEAGGRTSPERTRRGIWLVTSGLAKKVLIADFLLAPFVDLVFQRPGFGEAPFHLLAIYSFAFQIYFDFSGYTDIARGLALLLGYELPLNFREPYLSRTPSEFWRRWHITLSQWLRDYLYIPLGGNRNGPSRTVVNLFATMVLGGLWHGAAWNFAIWGAIHGGLLVAHRRFGRRGGEEDAWRLADAWKSFALFHAVCFAWIFFRAATFADATAFLGGFGSGWGAAWPWFQTAIVGLCAALHLAERALRTRAADLQAQFATRAWGPAVEGVACGALLALCVAASGAGAEFIYFQF